MNGVKKPCTFLIFPLFFIAAVFSSGCSSPIGVGGRGGVIGSLLGSSSDYIKAWPKRVVYEIEQSFIPADPELGVDVIGIFGGVEKVIEIGQLEFKLIENPDFYDKEVTVDKVNGYPFKDGDGGKKISVVITHKGMKTDYLIWVVEKGKGEPPGPGGGGTGIIVDWPE